jgi:hypothetical protein
LDDLGNPVQPLGELVEDSTDHIRLDMIDTESAPSTYTITQHPLQDLTDATTNNYRNLRRLELSGTWSSIETIGRIATAGQVLTGREKRRDLLKLDQLIAMADKREAIMVTTPRTTIPLGMIESISDPWTPDLSENTLVTIVIVETRIVTPLTSSAVLPDIAASATGNNKPSSAGNQAPTPIATQDVRPPPAVGAAPSFIVREVPA